MGLEAATYLSDLVTTNPVAGDSVGAGDDHIRLLKSTLQTTFPNASKAFRFPTTSAKSADFTVDADHTLWVVSASGAARTATLPAAATAGAGYRAAIIKIDSSTNTVTVDGDGSETINDATNYVLRSQYDAVVVESDGTEWWVIQAVQGALLAAILSGSIRQTGVITPTTLAANTNDWAPTGLSTASVIRASASAAYNVTSITAQSAGFVADLMNVGSYPITLMPDDGATGTAANRFSLPMPFVLWPGMAVKIFYDTTSSRWRLSNPFTPPAVAAGFKNLSISVSSATQAAITADALTLEDSNGLAYRARSVSVTAAITSSGANGLDTGAEANSTWYSIWVIYNPTSNTVAALLSESETSPTLPASYTFKARVGWVRNDSSGNFLRLLQKGRVAQYVIGSNPATELPSIASGSVGVMTATSISSVVPITAAEIMGHLSMQGDDNFGVSPNGSYTNVTLGQVNGDGDIASFNQRMYFRFVLESTNIYRLGNGTIRCLGWVDNI